MRVSCNGHSPAHPVELQLQPQETCRRRWPPLGNWQKLPLICAGNPPAFRQDACTGDSGGPLYLRNTTSGQDVLVGEGVDCDKVDFGVVPGTPGLYTNVANFTPWIAESAKVLLGVSGRPSVKGFAGSSFTVEGKPGEKLRGAPALRWVIFNRQGQRIDVRTLGTDLAVMLNGRAVPPGSVLKIRGGSLGYRPAKPRTQKEVTIAQPGMTIRVEQPYLQRSASHASWLDVWVTLISPPAGPLAGVLGRTFKGSGLSVAGATAAAGAATWTAGAMAKRLANPAPLGLFGFALTTALLQGGVTGITGKIGSIFELIRGTTLPAVAFVCYGAFWIGFAINGICGVTGAYPSIPHDGEKMFLALWGFITFFFFAASLCVNFVLQASAGALFLLLSVVFWLLAGGVANSHSHKAAGWIGLVVAGIAFYGGVAEMLNEMYDKTVLPLWPCSPGTSLLPHVQRSVGAIPLIGPAYLRAVEREDELAGRGKARELCPIIQPTGPMDKAPPGLPGTVELNAAVPV
ncbi:hypothetical protein ABPG75_011821 [Micractinium tetrahymenae]